MGNYCSSNRATAGGGTPSEANETQVLVMGNYCSSNRAAAGGGTPSEANETQVSVMGNYCSSNREAAGGGTPSEANETQVLVMGNYCSSNRAAAGGGTPSEANETQHIADPRRSLKGWMFEGWRLLCWSGVTLLVNHSDYDIKFYIQSPAFPGDERIYIFTLSAKTAKLIDKRRLDQFRESLVDTTVLLVSDLLECTNLTCTPDEFKEFCELNFRVIEGNQLESFKRRRRRRFTRRF